MSAFLIAFFLSLDILIAVSSYLHCSVEYAGTNVFSCYESKAWRIEEDACSCNWNKIDCSVIL